jgi:hypothetical protein
LLSSHELDALARLETPKTLFDEFASFLNKQNQSLMAITGLPPAFADYQKRLETYKTIERQHRFKNLAYLNSLKCHPHVLYYRNTINACSLKLKDKRLFFDPDTRNSDTYCRLLHDAAETPEQRLRELDFMVEHFICIIPKARVQSPLVLRYNEILPLKAKRAQMESLFMDTIKPKLDIYHRVYAKTQVYFPDKRLLQYDCGKLQALDKLLKELKQQGHRVLIFTQMSSMLNILEAFLSMHNYSYFRLDGATKIEQRQYLMERFNTDPKIFAFILSTRSGGLGVNLTGADTVIFYDSDWNPAMDAQAQDRCHRIGQTREVHIYRLISESTIEERILLKANQKRQMNEMVIHEGGFTPEFLKKLDARDFFDEDIINQIENTSEKKTEQEELTEKDVERALASAEDEADVIAYRNARKEKDEMFKMDFEEEFDQDLEKNLLNIEKYGISYLEMRSKESVEQEIANLEEEHRRNEETWRNNLEEIEEKQMSILNETDYDNMLEAGTPKSESSSASRITTSKSEQTTRRSSRKRKRSYGKSD